MPWKPLVFLLWFLLVVQFKGYFVIVPQLWILEFVTCLMVFKRQSRVINVCTYFIWVQTSVMSSEECSHHSQSLVPLWLSIIIVQSFIALRHLSASLWTKPSLWPWLDRAPWFLSLVICSSSQPLLLSSLLSNRSIQNSVVHHLWQKLILHVAKFYHVSAKALLYHCSCSLGVEHGHVIISEECLMEGFSIAISQVAVFNRSPFQLDHKTPVPRLFPFFFHYDPVNVALSVLARENLSITWRKWLRNESIFDLCVASALKGYVQSCLLATNLRVP